MIKIEIEKLKEGINIGLGSQGVWTPELADTMLIEIQKQALNIQNVVGSASDSDKFKRVLNTLRRNKVMVKTEEDGIYVRMAGVDKKGECFSMEWGRVVKF